MVVIHTSRFNTLYVLLEERKMESWCLSIICLALFCGNWPKLESPGVVELLMPINVTKTWVLAGYLRSQPPIPDLQNQNLPHKQSPQVVRLPVQV